MVDLNRLPKNLENFIFDLGLRTYIQSPAVDSVE